MMVDCQINFHGGDAESGDVFIVETIAAPDVLLESHKHDHAHTSILVSGVADVTVDGVTERMTGYRMVTIPAKTMHAVRSVTDIVWLCLWADSVAPKQQAIDSLKLIQGEANVVECCGRRRLDGNGCDGGG